MALIGCSQNKDNSYISEQPLHDLCIIISKDSSELVSFTIEKTPRDGGQVILESYNNLDTLSTSLNYPSFLLINFDDTSNDTILVYPADTVWVECNNGETSVISHEKFVWPELDSYGKTLSDSIDSINNILHKHTHLRMVPDYGSMKLRSIPKNPQSMEGNDLLLNGLIDLKVKKLQSQLNTFQHLRAENSLLFKLYEETLTKHLFMELSDLTYLKKFNVFEKLQVIDDSILDRRYGRLYLSNYIRHQIIENLENRTKDKVHIDYGMAYDVLPEYFSGEVLKYTRQMCLERMYSNGENNTDMKQYFNRYCEQYDDTVYQKSFRSTYLIDHSALANESDKLNLIDEDGNTTTLSELISQNRGNVLYIDFWASWCKPCRVEMPSSRELKTKYKDRDVKFVYISIDQLNKNWVMASKAEKIDTDNYLVLNYNNSRFVKNKKINSIPRYLLYDQNGKLVNERAPRPSSKEIRKLFDRIL